MQPDILARVCTCRNEIDITIILKYILVKTKLRGVFQPSINVI